MALSVAPPDERVVWHDLECGGYSADLPLWRELAERTGSPVLDLGAGTGRVALHLAARGHEVVALDREAALLEALRDRAHGRSVRAVRADARSFALGEAFALCLVPMQTLQLLTRASDRAALLRAARAHLVPGGLFAAALAEDLEPFDLGRAALPRPDRAIVGAVVYESQPVAVRTDGDQVLLERVRTVREASGALRVEEDVVALARLDAAGVRSELAAAGFRAEPDRTIPPTREHVGSRVVVGRA